ncbi:MFS transporter [Rhizobium sullae]|uniref:MFS transporter n=1 Tax=Rhizobium sullae TaxID=50338 RepID=A0A4V2VA10_RHISU|nr:MFS transporter [Rhizobium sullae]TCU19185.1 MFS transporter [Rhizobium sullae]
MPSAFSSILHDHRIRIPVLTLIALAFTYASTLPYQSIIGISELGMSDGNYSLLIFGSAIINVTTSLTLGVWSDRLGDRRPLVLCLSVAGMLGFGMIYAFHTPAVFILCVLFLIPMSNSTYSILFASVRVATNAMDRGRAASIVSAVRALYSGSWALAPGLIGLYLVDSQSMTPAFGIAGLASFTCCSISLLLGLHRLSGVLYPLIITHAAGGSAVDVGFVAGLIAFLEMPFVMMWGMLQRRFRSVHILAAGTLTYCIYLALLGVASAPWHIYALVLVNACGASALLSVPITYLQDLIADRPGLGSSLISVTSFVSSGVSALIFAVGTAITDYSGTAVLGAVIGLCAIGMLLFLESSKRQVRQLA